MNILQNLRTAIRSIKQQYRSEIKTPVRMLLYRKKIGDLFNEIKLPSTLYIECTNVCNALCIFCYYPKIKDERPRKTMSINLFNSIIDDYESIGGSKISLTPTVGDPLVDKLFSERIKIIDKSRIEYIHFYTNLINFRESHIEALQNVTRTTVEVNVSISGFNSERYHTYMGVNKFDRVIRNLQRLSEIDNPHVIKHVVLRDYSGSSIEKKQLTSLLSDLHLDFDIYTEYDSWGGLVENMFEEHAELKQKRLKARKGPCQISYTKPVITVDGELKLCDCRDVNNELIVGKMTGNNFYELWNGEKIQSIRALMYSHEEMPNICKKCELYTSIYDPDSAHIIN